MAGLERFSAEFWRSWNKRDTEISESWLKVLLKLDLKEDLKTNLKMSKIQYYQSESLTYNMFDKSTCSLFGKCQSSLLWVLPINRHVFFRIRIDTFSAPELGSWRSGGSTCHGMLPPNTPWDGEEALTIVGFFFVRLKDQFGWLKVGETWHLLEWSSLTIYQ